MFPWAFGNTARNYVRPDSRPFEDFDELSLGDLKVQALPVQHADSPTHGFLFTLPTGERIAYLPDVKVIPPESLHRLKELDLLIIDALRHEPHPTHMSLEEALDTATQLSPKETAFTHLTHDLDFVETTSRLPANTFVASDGLTIDFPS